MRKNKIWFICFGILILSQIVQITPRIHCPNWNPLSCEGSVRVRIRQVQNNESPIKSGVGFPYLEIIGFIVIAGTLIYSVYYTLDRRRMFFYNKKTHQCFDKENKSKEIDCPSWIIEREKK